MECPEAFCWDCGSTSCFKELDGIMATHRWVNKELGFAKGAQKRGPTEHVTCGKRVAKGQAA